MSEGMFSHLVAPMFPLLQADEERRRDREMADFYDDRMIKEMEKKLKLDKRKKDTLPKAFMDDGLDCILS